MNRQEMPICVREMFSLPKNCGINQDNITFGNVRMESDKWIVVCESGGYSKQVVIINIADTHDILRYPICADSAVMNPNSKILALKSGKQLQMFDLELKTKLKTHMATDDVLFLKWLTPDIFAIITNNSVYHWSLCGESAPSKIFDLHSTLRDSQIINYRSDAEGKFLVLNGIAVKDCRIVGSLQLYSVDGKCSQLIEGHTACFVHFKMDGNAQPSNLLCFSVRNDSFGKLHIYEISPPPNGNEPFPKKSVDIIYPMDAKSDFPVSMQASSKYGILYMITKYGYAHIFDIEIGLTIYSVRISPHTIFISTVYALNDGIVCINRSGQVINVCLDKANIIDYVIQQLKNSNLASKLASRFNLSIEAVEE